MIGQIVAGAALAVWVIVIIIAVIKANRKEIERR